MTVAEAIQKAVQLQSAGRSIEAAALYESVLRVQPNHTDALHLLGLVESSKKNHARAVELIQRAIEIVPDSSLFYGNLGVVLRFADRIEEAISAYRRSIALNPDAPDMYFNLGKSLKLKGNVEEAEAAFRHAVKLAPTKSSPWLSLMNISVERKELESAISIGRQGLENCPGSAEIHMNLGVVYKRLRNIDQALAYYRAAVKLAPDNVDALCKLSATLIDRQAIEEGQQLLQRARAIEPESMYVLTTFGILHNALGNSEAAVRVLRDAIGHYPKHGAAYIHLGIALKKLGKLSEALQAMQQAVSIDLVTAEALANQAGVLMSLGRLDEAEACFVEASKERDGFRDSHANLLMCQQYQPNLNAKTILENHRNWDQLYATNLRGNAVVRTNPDPIRPLRIGFVSGDLGMHPVGFFTIRLFESLAKEALLTFVYSDRAGRDPLAARIEKSVHHWNDVAALGDDALAERIRSDGIDILFDLAGHTAHNRLLVFARRAAPIQVSWAGYVGTTGVTEMDYVLGDHFHIPPEFEKFISEKVLRMPHGYVSYEAPEGVPEVSTLPALRTGYVTFGSMCNPAKVNSKVLELWGRILQRALGSRLILCYTGWADPANQRRVRDAFDSFGVSDQVDFDQKSGVVDLMGRYCEVDIALDTFPYSGGLTTCEALWMGVPTVTWPWERFAGRHSLSHLSNVGLSNWVATDAESYVSMAVDRAKDLHGLAELRCRLRSQIMNSPLCNGPLFADDFSAVMRDAWRRWCELQNQVQQ